MSCGIASFIRLLGVLLAEVLGRVNHVDQRSLGLGPRAGLQTTVRVDPELVGAEVLKHLLDTAADLLFAGDTGRVDIVDTGSDVTGVGLVNEHLEELGVRLAVLDTEDISVEGGNGVEEVLELGVTEVRVDLSSITDTCGGKAESLDSPCEVVLTGLSSAEG